MVRKCTILAVYSEKYMSGNLTTALRLKSFVEERDFSCDIFHPDHCDYSELYKSSLILAIHAYYCSSCILSLPPSRRPPYIVIFGGTDVNTHVRDLEKRRVMARVLSSASYIVAFSSGIAKSAQIHWPEVQWGDKLRIIPQSIRLSTSREIHQNPQFLDLPEKSYAIWIGGIRAVKDPLFAIRTFLNENSTLDLVLVGPEIEPELGVWVKKLANESGRIHYFGAVSKAETESLLARSLVLINTSISEGMPAAPLEAMVLGVPVLARRVEGNSNIISDGVNGLLFSSESELGEKLVRIQNDHNLRAGLTSRGRSYIEENHNPRIESALYGEMIRNLCS